MRTRRMIAGLIVLFLGVVFLLMNFGIIPPSFGMYWPVLLIIIGAAILAKPDSEEWVRKKK